MNQKRSIINKLNPNQQIFSYSDGVCKIVKPKLEELSVNVRKSLKSLNFYFKNDKIYFYNKKTYCPHCGSKNYIKNGFYHERKLEFVETGGIEVSVQRYKCKKCGKRFQADLSEIVDSNSNFTQGVKNKAKQILGTFLGSLHNVTKSLKDSLNISVSHQSIENWLSQPNTFLRYGEGRYSGYYVFDVEWVKISGNWHYRHTLMDAVSREIIADKIYKEETKETVYDFLYHATFNKNIKAITTDLDTKYENIMDRLGFKHQYCIFHAKKNFNDKLKDKNLSDENFEIAKKQLDSVMDFFDYDNFKKANDAFQDLFFKKDEFMTEVWDIIITLILPRYKKFIYHAQDSKITKTSNLIENAFSKTLPKHRKKQFKTIKSVLKRINLRNLIWNENRQKDRQKKEKKLNNL